MTKPKTTEEDSEKNQRFFWNQKGIDILIETIQRHSYPVYCNPEYCGIKEKHRK